MRDRRRVCCGVRRGRRERRRRRTHVDATARRSGAALAVGCARGRDEAAADAVRERHRCVRCDGLRGARAGIDHRGDGVALRVARAVAERDRLACVGVRRCDDERRYRAVVVVVGRY